MGKSLRKQKSQKSQKRWDRERPTIAVDNSYPNEYYDRLELIVSAFPGKVVALLRNLDQRAVEKTKKFIKKMISGEVEKWKQIILNVTTGTSKTTELSSLNQEADSEMKNNDIFVFEDIEEFLSIYESKLTSLVENWVKMPEKSSVSGEKTVTSRFSNRMYNLFRPVEKPKQFELTNTFDFMNFQYILFPDNSHNPTTAYPSVIQRYELRSRSRANHAPENNNGDSTKIGDFERNLSRGTIHFVPNPKPVMQTSETSVEVSALCLPLRRQSNHQQSIDAEPMTQQSIAAEPMAQQSLVDESNPQQSHTRVIPNPQSVKFVEEFFGKDLDLPDTSIFPNEYFERLELIEREMRRIANMPLTRYETRESRREKLIDRILNDLSVWRRILSKIAGENSGYAVLPFKLEVLEDDSATTPKYEPNMDKAFHLEAMVGFLHIYESRLRKLVEDIFGLPELHPGLILRKFNTEHKLDRLGNHLDFYKPGFKGSEFDFISYGFILFPGKTDGAGANRTFQIGKQTFKIFRSTSNETDTPANTLARDHFKNIYFEVKDTSSPSQQYLIHYKKVPSQEKPVATDQVVPNSVAIDQVLIDSSFIQEAIDQEAIDQEIQDALEESMQGRDIPFMDENYNDTIHENYATHEDYMNSTGKSRS